MHEVHSGAFSDDRLPPHESVSPKLSLGDVKAVKLWQDQRVAIDAAKADAQKNVAPKILDKRFFSLENVKLQKAYTEEYIKQLKETSSSRQASTL